VLKRVKGRTQTGIEVARAGSKYIHRSVQKPGEKIKSKRWKEGKVSRSKRTSLARRLCSQSLSASLDRRQTGFLPCVYTYAAFRICHIALPMKSPRVIHFHSRFVSFFSSTRTFKSILTSRLQTSISRFFSW